MLLKPRQQSLLFGQGLVHPRRFGHLGITSLQDLQIRKDQFQIDGLNIPHGVHTAVHMYYIGVLEASDHMDDGVHLPDIAQKLVAQPLSL